MADANDHQQSFYNYPIPRNAPDVPWWYQRGKPLGILDGVPIAIKDSAQLKGYKDTWGSPLDFSHQNGTEWCIKMLEDVGCIVIGRSNMHQFGIGKTP